MTLDVIKLSKTKLAWSTKKCIIIAVISLVIGLAIFMIAYVSMNKHILLDIYNQPILSWMVSYRKEQITPIILAITSIASSAYFSAIVFAIAIFWAVTKRELWRPILLIGSIGFCSVVSTIIKSVVENARPLSIYMVRPLENDYSFPSGHTLAIVVFSLVIGYLIVSRHSSNFRATIWFITTIVLTSIIAFSRLYLGYHWLTDVTASIGLGFIILSLVIFVDRIFINMYKN